MAPLVYSYFVVTIIVSLTLLLFFAGAEVAFSALLDHEIIARVDKETVRARRLKQLLLNRQSLMQALKLARIACRVMFVGSSTWFTLLLTQRNLFAPEWFVPIMFFLLCAILISVNDFWAGGYVLSRHLYFAEMFSLPVLICFKAIQPAIIIHNAILKLLVKHMGFQNGNKSQADLLSLVEDGKHGGLEDEEREMIHSIIEFRDTEAHEIMVPRTDMICIEESVGVEVLTKLITEKGHSRIPLFREDVDNILGVIYAKDLLSQTTPGRDNQPKLTEIARPAYFVPETKRLHDLLRDFQRDKHHMAIVLDEYGGTAGLITLEDIIEEIVGDIQDEYDREAPLVRRIDDHNHFVEAKIDLHELNDVLNVDLPTEGEYESLGGFILSLTGYVPEEKEVVTFDKYRFTVESVNRNRIITVKLTTSRISGSDGESEPASSHEN